MRRVLSSLALAVLCPGTLLWAAPKPLGSPFPLSTCSLCTQQSPEAAGTPSGAFMVVWQAATGAGAQIETVPGRLFTNTGAPRAPEFATDPASGTQDDGAVAADPQGNYVAVWSAEVDGQRDIFAQRYTSRGRALGPVLQVSADSPSSPMPPDDLLPAVAKSADGG
ncbi:MAG TPA: hypothetical protein VMM92_07865, partial [Thermoanaerobaculia bacterium]|nr:hypothetical protein [Thermoanaerobaculia bacterium]